MIGATAGRTTLTGEGTQHMDGHSHMIAATNPAVVAYDPAYGYELAHIMQDGLRRMYGENPEDVIYYITVYNEPMVQPAEPENVDVEGILKGMYLLKEGSFEGVGQDARRAQLLASGVGVAWALEAQELLDISRAMEASQESEGEPESPDEPLPPDLDSSSEEEEEEKQLPPAWTEEAHDVRVTPFDAPTGKQHGARHAVSPLSFLQLFLSPGLLQQWTDYTNDYAQQCAERS